MKRKTDEPQVFQVVVPLIYTTVFIDVIGNSKETALLQG
jgi:hypothetical protein